MAIDLVRIDLVKDTVNVLGSNFADNWLKNGRFYHYHL